MCPPKVHAPLLVLALEIAYPEGSVTGRQIRASEESERDFYLRSGPPLLVNAHRCMFSINLSCPSLS